MINLNKTNIGFGVKLRRPKVKIPIKTHGHKNESPLSSGSHMKIHIDNCEISSQVLTSPNGTVAVTTYSGNKPILTKVISPENRIITTLDPKTNNKISSTEIDPEGNLSTLENGRLNVISPWFN